MGRKIKFRSWDESFHLMNYPDDVMCEDEFITCEGKVVEKEESHSYLGTEISFNDISEKRTLMQYVLTNMHGKDVYEGDIVKGYWWENGEKHRHIGIVTFVMSAFKVRGAKQYLGLDDELNPTYEVIGNIYENPELL